MKTDKTEKLVIGRVGSAAGVKGEFRVNLYAADSANLKEGKNLLFRHSEDKRKSSEKTENNDNLHAGTKASGKTINETEDFEAVCKSVRYQKDKPVIKVEGVEDRNAAEALRNMEVYIDESELDELPEGEHYVRNLIGCTVRDIASGADIGTLTDVIQNTAQSVLEVETPDKKNVLIPAVDAFMRNIDEKERLIEVELIPGFLE